MASFTTGISEYLVAVVHKRNSEYGGYGNMIPDPQVSSIISKNWDNKSKVLHLFDIYTETEVKDLIKNIKFFKIYLAVNYLIEGSHALLSIYDIRIPRVTTIYH